MKVLLTGAAGFIGRAALARAQAAGHDVVCFDRAGDPADDITDLDRVRAAINGCDAVLHLAAKVGLGVDLGDLDGYARDNDLGTAIVLRVQKFKVQDVQRGESVRIRRRRWKSTKLYWHIRGDWIPRLFCAG